MSSQAPQPSSTAEASAATIFNTDRSHLIGAAVMGLISLLVAGQNPLLLGWVILLPILFSYWVIKTKTVVDPKGIHAHYAFRGTKSVDWADFAGIRFGGSKAFARDITNEEFFLPGITFNSLPALSEASSGRIVDALTSGREAAADKVVIIHRDGRQIIKNRDEVEDTDSN